MTVFEKRQDTMERPLNVSFGAGWSANTHLPGTDWSARQVLYTLNTCSSSSTVACKSRPRPRAWAAAMTSAGSEAAAAIPSLKVSSMV